MQTLPLTGVLVISVETAAAGPLAARNLADLGARVIRVERRNDDPSRSLDPALGSWSSTDLWVNPSKESFGVNFKHPRALEILNRLLERADVLIENMRPGLVQQMGLRYELLKQLNPRLIMCHISGYGQDGPYRLRKAYDFITQGEVGLIELTGSPEAPARVGAAVVDSMTAQHATIAILSALLKARATGVGEEIDVAMLESATWFLSQIPFNYWYRGDRPPRMGCAIRSCVLTECTTRPTAASPLR